MIDVFDENNVGISCDSCHEKNADTRADIGVFIRVVVPGSRIYFLFISPGSLFPASYMRLSFSAIIARICSMPFFLSPALR